MQSIRSVGVLSCAKTMGAVYGLLGVLFIPVFLIASMAGFASKSSGSGGALAGIGMLAMAIIMPFLYAAIGFVAGAITAWFYNLVAKVTGGIQLEMGTPTSF